LKILAVDTALGACSTAVLDGESVLAHIFEPMERGHAERLAPMVRDAMAAAQLDFAALERLAVTVGPGTFTGQRVGYAFMRGLRLATGLPLVGVTTLEAMARAAAGDVRARRAAVFHDAKRGEVYCAAIDGERTLLPVQIAPLETAIGMLRELVRGSDGTLALAGTAADAAAHVLRESGIEVTRTEITAPDALWVARMGLSASEPDDVPRPLYLRPPDARLPGPPAMTAPVRPGTLADLPAIAKLHAECFVDAWDTEFLGRLLAQPGAFSAIAVEHDVPVGFVLARAVAGEAEVLSLGVQPRSRRRSVGTALVRSMIERALQTGAAEVFLEVGVENAAARRLYGRLGFAEVGARSAYYRRDSGPGTDALILRYSP
jgi:tRNA threonylcarbamoyladenosine biosynthesis protein TsaB